MRLLLLPLTLLGLSLLAPAGAEEPAEEEAAARQAEETRTDRRVRKLAEEYGVKKEDVLGLREKGMGWGEIRHALAISKRSEKPLAEIVALREEGLGWGQIARKHGFSLGEVSGKGRSREKLRDAPKERGVERRKGPTDRGKAERRGKGRR